MFVIDGVKPGVDFTNILQAAFTRADPKSAKNYSQVISLFCAFGICARKSCMLMLVKLTSEVRYCKICLNSEMLLCLALPQFVKSSKMIWSNEFNHEAYVWGAVMMPSGIYSKGKFREI